MSGRGVSGHVLPRRQVSQFVKDRVMMTQSNNSTDQKINGLRENDKLRRRD